MDASKRPSGAVLAGLRDGAIFNLVMNTAVTPSSAIAMQVGDYYRVEDAAWIRLVVDGIEEREAVDPAIRIQLDAYIWVAGIDGEPDTPLFRHLERQRVTACPLTKREALRIIRDQASRVKRRRRKTGATAPVEISTPDLIPRRATSSPTGPAKRKQPAERSHSGMT